MCGISGIYAEQISLEHENILSAIIESQLQRGPDHQAVTKILGKDVQVLLGHNRLSIIDLSTHSNQPMWDTTGRYCISYNGEIYNYLELRNELQNLGLTFNTNGDTEVILNAYSAWGIKCLDKLHGPFAFGLFDKDTDVLWLCRDRFGVRPLYYVKQNNILYFASSTAALAQKLNLSPNLAYLSRGLTYLVFEDDSEISPYTGIFSLPPGHYAQITLNLSKELLLCQQRYYDLTAATENLIHTLPIDNTEQLLKLVNDAFEQAVHVRLRSDVPLGISLSSGLDSSAVAACVAKQHHNTIGFSFGHPDVKTTEGPLVKKTANFLNIKMEYIWPSQTEMIEGLFKTIVAQDAPFSSLSIVAQYLLYQRVQACGVKVLLGGQGGDESFMGYKKFLLFWLQQLFNQKRYMASAKNIVQLIPMLFAEMRSLSAYWRHRHRYFNSKNSLAGHALQLPGSSLLNLRATQHANLSYRQIQDITQFSLPTLLRYEDRNAMANSIESRMPFLDHRLVELGIALPTAIKLRSGLSKWPLRQIMHNRIPNSIRLARYKRGFDIPLAQLLKSGLGHSIRTVLHNNLSMVQELLKKNASIDTMYSDQQLMQRPSAMAEAIALLWLNKKEIIL